MPIDHLTWKSMTRRFPRVPAKFRMEQCDVRAAPGAPLVAHERPVLALAFSPDGRSLAASGGGLMPGASTIRVIDVETRAVRRICHGHVMGVFDLAFDPRTGLLASASHDYSVLLWEVDQQNDAIYLIGDPNAGISRHRVAFAGSCVVIGDGETFAGEHASLTMVDLDDGASRALLAFDRRLGVGALDVLRRDEGLVILVDQLRDSRVVAEVRVVGFDGAERARWSIQPAVRDLVAVEGSQLVAIVYDNGGDDGDEVTELLVLDASTGARRAARALPGARFGSMASSPDGDLVAVAWQHTAEVFAVDGLGSRLRIDLGADDGLSIAWSPAGLLAVGTLARTVRLFDAQTGREHLE